VFVEIDCVLFLEALNVGPVEANNFPLAIDNPVLLIVAIVVPPDCRFKVPVLSAVVIIPPAPLVDASIEAIYTFLLN
jgi:hypothetical protein